MNLSEKIRSSSLGSRASRIWTACEGMVAVEFALIAPVMLVIFFGVSELSDGLEANTKVISVVSSAADLVAQEKVICNAEMADVFAALNAIMFPYPVNNMQIRISSLVDAGSGLVTVAWSDAQNMTPRTVNSPFVGLPAGLMDPSGSVIYTEVAYNYTSVSGQWLHGTIVLGDKFYTHPRKVAQITRTATSC